MNRTPVVEMIVLCLRAERMILLFCLVYIFIFIVGCHSDQPEKNDSPNIVLIVSDDQGYHDIASYGADDIKTPNLDLLVSEGALLTNFYVTSSVCTPSRCSMLTGRYPQRNGTYELFRNELPDTGYEYTDLEYSTTPERILGTDLKEVFISEVLKKAGYKNGIFGKWDLGQLRRFLPLQQGFDDFYGFVNTGIDYYTHERYGVSSMYNGNELTRKDSGTYSTFLFEREALDFLNKNHTDPFFLYLPFNAPHNASNLDPEIRRSVQAPPEYLNMYPGMEKRRRGYCAAVTAMDHSIGNILARIEQLGETDNTLVIFLSDNGGGLGSKNDPLRGGKATFLEGGVRVPCIIKWPGKIEKNIVIDEFLSSLEIFSTILAAGGIQTPDSIILDGFNMLPLLQGEGETARETMFWEFRGGYAARVGDYKWVDDQKGNQGFFNLAEDPDESRDLSNSQRSKLEEVKRAFVQWQKEMKNSEDRGPFKDF